MYSAPIVRHAAATNSTMTATHCTDYEVGGTMIIFQQAACHGELRFGYSVVIVQEVFSRRLQMDSSWGA